MPLVSLSNRQSDNPYAPPSIEGNANNDLQNAASGAPQSVVRASGRLSFQEGRLANRLTSVGIFRQVVVFVVLAVALLALYGFSRHDLAALFSLDALPVFGIIVLLMGGFVLLSRGR